MSDRFPLNEVKMRVDREHARCGGGCVCGAKFGDSVDARWHLINEVAEAVAREVLKPLVGLVDRLWDVELDADVALVYSLAVEQLLKCHGMMPPEPEPEPETTEPGGRCGACRDLGGDHTERPGCRFAVASPLPEVLEVRRVRLDPGDVLAVHSPDVLSMSHADRIRGRVSRYFPGHEVVVFGNGLRMEIVEHRPCCGELHPDGVCPVLTSEGPSHG